MFFAVGGSKHPIRDRLQCNWFPLYVFFHRFKHEDSCMCSGPTYVTSYFLLWLKSGQGSRTTWAVNGDSPVIIHLSDKISSQATMHHTRQQHATVLKFIFNQVCCWFRTLTSAETDFDFHKILVLIISWSNSPPANMPHTIRTSASILM